jgi:hypothetical protein
MIRDHPAERLYATLRFARWLDGRLGALARDDWTDHNRGRLARVIADCEAEIDRRHQLVARIAGAFAHNEKVI